MNMILAGDGHANIIHNEKGSLIDKKTELYDIVITNIPFSLPINDKVEGVIYSIASKNGNSICVQHCIDSLKKQKNSRAAIIVPEQFVFDNSCKETREWILKTWNVFVVSLPQGVFLPYTIAKSCILFLEYTFLPQGGKLEFLKLNHVGFTKNKSKMPISKNELLDYLLNPDEFKKVEINKKDLIMNNFKFKPLIKYFGLSISEIFSFAKKKALLISDKNYFEIKVKKR